MSDGGGANGERAGVLLWRGAEKKAADHALSMPPKLEAFPAPRFVFEVPVALAPVWTVHPYTREFESWTVPPPTPPPA